MDKILLENNSNLKKNCNIFLSLNSQEGRLIYRSLQHSKEKKTHSISKHNISSLGFFLYMRIRIHNIYFKLHNVKYVFFKFFRYFSEKKGFTTAP
jgi:hypothetical protein